MVTGMDVLRVKFIKKSWDLNIIFTMLNSTLSRPNPEKFDISERRSVQTGLIFYAGYRLYH
jgi:hypothetical protein